MLGSVCDQVSTNVAAITALQQSHPDTKIGADGGNSGQLLMYKLQDTIVIHCYDVPHLLKGTRNNLQTKNLRHSVSKRWTSSLTSYRNSEGELKQLTASWKDISDTYGQSLKGSRRLLTKITPEHINPEKLKMKVSVAAQVFSQTYGEVMLEKKLLKRDCTGTANILIFFNDLFDSLNGSCSTINELKSPVTETSVHFLYWDYALYMLSKMKFIDKVKNVATNRTKNIQNWESTVRGYCELSKKCLNLGMTKIALRYQF